MELGTPPPGVGLEGTEPPWMRLGVKGDPGVCWTLPGL